MNNICRPLLLSVFWVLTSFNLCNLYTGHASIPMYRKCISLFFNYIVPLEKTLPFTWCIPRDFYPKKTSPINLEKPPDFLGRVNFSPISPGVNRPLRELPRDPASGDVGRSWSWRRVSDLRVQSQRRGFVQASETDGCPGWYGGINGLVITPISGWVHALGRLSTNLLTSYTSYFHVH